MRLISITGDSFEDSRLLLFTYTLNDSGDISIDELKIGLSKLSIFMYPYELREVRERNIISLSVL
jgi:hypothetical protein